MNIKPLIYDLLRNDAGVSTIVGIKIFPSFAPSNIAEPLIIYQIISETPQRTQTGATTFYKYRLQLSLYGFDSLSLSQLTDAIRTLTDTKRFTIQGKELSIFSENDIDSSEAPKDASEQAVYKTVLDYFVWVSTI